jgi:CDP-diacylglycerol---glycerol-3-phosphate 3-phosphatidyltransferase
MRAALAAVFFAMLARWPHDADRPTTVYLNIAMAIYIVATFTDAVDGYLARKWNVTSVFGRIMDPLVDKILVLGSFIYFAGPSFVHEIDGHPTTLTGVTPTVVVLLLLRELFVTAMRAVAEGDGKSYGAVWSGKIKMVLQCVTIGVILAYVNYYPVLRDHAWEPTARLFRDICVWGTVVVTVFSGLIYVRRSLQLARE